MLQWQIVQHNINGEIKYTLSLIKVKDGKFGFILSISIEKDDNGNHVVIRNSEEKGKVLLLTPENLATFILYVSNDEHCIVSYEDKPNV